MMSKMSSWIFLPCGKIFWTFKVFCLSLYKTDPELNKKKHISIFHLRISTRPVVPSTSAMLRQVDILWVVQVCIGRVEDRVNHSGLQIKENCTGNVVLIISLRIFNEQAGDRLVKMHSVQEAASLYVFQLLLQSRHLQENNVLAPELHTRMIKERIHGFIKARFSYSFCHES